MRTQYATLDTLPVLIDAVVLNNATDLKIHKNKPADKLNIKLSDLDIAEKVCGLKDWRVMLITREGGGCTIHLVGERGTQGIVTSHVLKYDKLIAQTANRKYILIGKPGFSSLAMATWFKWLKTYKIGNYTDITHKY